MPSHNRGLTITEVLVVLTILILIVAVVLPLLGSLRREARSQQSNSQVRGIHQAMVMHAQHNGGFFPGLDESGEIVGASVEARFQVLLDGNYFTGDFAISPQDSGKTPWRAGEVVTVRNYSFAMLQIADGGGRLAEWRESFNAEAPMMSDRKLGTPADPHSLHTQPGKGWRGHVVFNDNHVLFASSHILDTRFGDGPVNRRDNLFEAAGTDDAYLIHVGE
jgi:type II secretory pathway pseudopilin PulG